MIINYPCVYVQSELVLPDSSSEEVRFLLDQIDILNEQQQQLNNTATTGFYWIGQTSRFQLSIPVNSGVLYIVLHVYQKEFLQSSTHYLHKCLLAFIQYWKCTMRLA